MMDRDRRLLVPEVFDSRLLHRALPNETFRTTAMLWFRYDLDAGSTTTARNPADRDGRKLECPAPYVVAVPFYIAVVLLFHSRRKTVRIPQPSTSFSSC